jgi:putative CocE/NonD family hydrolase
MRESVAGRVPARPAAGLPRHVRVLLRLARRELPEPVCQVAVDRGIEVPAADGVPLLTDHYHPVYQAGAVGGEGQWPTLLVRTPYGRGFPWDYVYGALFARQGFHVVIQSCRGTGGSGGEFEPFRDEPADGQAAVAWLRRQDWFSGALGTIGASYLGYTQWALAADPPPELGAMVVQVGLDDLHRLLYPGGAFTLEATLSGVAAMLSMQRGFARFLLAAGRLLRQHRRVERGLPLIDAYPAAFGRRVGFLEQWLAHPDAADPFWASRRAAPEMTRIPPVSLLTGWSDICLDQTLGMYRRLREAGRAVRLTVGPWNHTSGFNDDMPAILGDALSWLRAHLGGDQSSLPGQPVRVHVGEIGGRGRWRDLAGWPPPGAAPRSWHLHPGGALAAEPPGQPVASAFRYDPAAPTPSVGGPSMDARSSGAQRNDALERRRDVLIFTGAALAAPLEVIGPVSARLRVRAGGPHFDVFARLCDVDPRGRSWNICDGLIRLGPGSPDEVTVPMSATAHRFGAGHRLRLQISGGAHPRFARNTGTGEPLATASRLVPVDIEIGGGTLLVTTSFNQ